MSIQTLLPFPAAPAFATTIRKSAPRTVRTVAPQAYNLHAHSRYSAFVSENMILETIVPAAWRKGMDVMGTGDCLQLDWLRHLDERLIEDGSGFLALRPEFEAACATSLPARFRRPLRFVLTTEVCCAPPGLPKSARIHHLLLFRTLDSARGFHLRVAPYGDLRQGRPRLALTSRQLMALVIAHGEDTELAPAHVLSPVDSALGSLAGHRSLGEVFGEFSSRILAVEMGCTATPAMCRRLSSLDGYSLFCSSDAHSLGNIGREYTLLDIEPSYSALVSALRTPDHGRVRGFVKFPATETGDYYNGCRHCGYAYDAPSCPKCHQPLIPGSRDRAEALADRPTPHLTAASPPTRELLPLSHLLAHLTGFRLSAKAVHHRHQDLLHELGDERYVLTEAPVEEIACVHTHQLAQLIARQRETRLRRVQGRLRTAVQQPPLEF